MHSPSGAARGTFGSAEAETFVTGDGMGRRYGLQPLLLISAEEFLLSLFPMPTPASTCVVVLFAAVVAGVIAVVEGVAVWCTPGP